jgi:hypothetical protein
MANAAASSDLNAQLTGPRCTAQPLYSTLRTPGRHVSSRPSDSPCKRSESERRGNTFSQVHCHSTGAHIYHIPYVFLILLTSLTANPSHLCSDTVRYALVRHPVPVRTHFVSASKFFAPKAAPTESSVVVPDGSSPMHVDPSLLPPAQAYLAWPLGIPVSLYFHLSTSEQVFARDSDLPQFVWHDITFGDWNEARTVNYNVHLPEVRVP